VFVGFRCSIAECKKLKIAVRISASLTLQKFSTTEPEMSIEKLFWLFFWKKAFKYLPLHEFPSKQI
jgi:hypothetical protein